jgi:hypothetical protein
MYIMAMEPIEFNLFFSLHFLPSFHYSHSKTVTVQLFLCVMTKIKLSGNTSPDIIRQIKSRRMWWAEHMACIGEG